MERINEINNKELKENIANAALGLLTEGEDYKELVYTKVEFGYLFDIEERGIEALFKVITDTTIAYFAVQLNKLMRLNLTEELYKAYVEGFIDCNN
mgnify:CR=1 FL=1